MKNTYNLLIKWTFFMFSFIIINTTAIAQNKIVSGVIIDAITMTPIESVSINLVDSNLSTISNAEGKYRITIPTNRKLKFSHLGYKPFEQEVKDGTTELEIYLEPSTLQLDEVIVRSKPVKELLSDAVTASKNKLEKSILIQSYYREFVKVDNQYTNFSDGLLDYNVKRKSGASDLYVKQSRAYKLMDENTNEREKKREALYFYDVKDAVSEAYNFRDISRILNSKSYDFEIETKTDDKGNSIEIVTILPKEEVVLHLFSGTVVFDAKTNLILEMDIKKSPKHLDYAQELNAVFFRFKVYEQARKSSFRIDGDKYILVYNQNKLNVYLNMKDKFDNTFEFMSDMVVSDYQEGEFDFDRSKRHKEKSLFSAGNHFTEAYWKTQNVILLTQEEQKVLETLH